VAVGVNVGTRVGVREAVGVWVGGGVGVSGIINLVAARQAKVEKRSIVIERAIL